MAGTCNRASAAALSARCNAAADTDDDDAGAIVCRKAATEFAVCVAESPPGRFQDVAMYREAEMLMHAAAAEYNIHDYARAKTAVANAQRLLKPVSRRHPDWAEDISYVETGVVGVIVHLLETGRYGPGEKPPSW